MRAWPDAVVLRPPLSVMIASPAGELPGGLDGRWAYEPKLDGFRAVAFRDGRGGVRLQSRQQRDLTRYFPDVVEGLADQLDGDVVLDGEIVVARQGRCDFAALQRRLSSGAAGGPAACLVAFDILAVDGCDLRVVPYRERRERLVELLVAARPPLALTPMTLNRAAAGAWLAPAAGVEGIVAKRTDHAYRPARRTSWRKIRIRATEEAIVGGVIGSLQAPTALILGRHDQPGRLRITGRTTTLAGAARREVAAVLAPAQASHPWPELIPSGRFGQWPTEAGISYVKAAPTLVVEIAAHNAFEHGRWRHPVPFVRIRADLQPDDLIALAGTDGGDDTRNSLAPGPVSRASSGA